MDSDLNEVVAADTNAGLENASDGSPIRWAVVHDPHIVMSVEMNETDLLVGVRTTKRPNGGCRHSMVPADDEREKRLLQLEDSFETVLDDGNRLLNIHDRKRNLADLPNPKLLDVDIEVRAVSGESYERFAQRVWGGVSRVRGDRGFAQRDTDDPHVKRAAEVPRLQPIRYPRLEPVLGLRRDDQLLDGIARGRVDGPGGLELPRQEQPVEGAEDPVLVVGLPAEPAQHA